MPDAPLPFLDTQRGSNGSPVGAKSLGPFFVSSQYGLVLTDSVTGSLYSLSVASGVLTLTPITI